MTRFSRTFRADATMLTALAVGIVVLLLTSASRQPTAPTGRPISPAETVRQFLGAVLSRGDGMAACDFLSPAERTRIGGMRRCEAAVAHRRGPGLGTYVIRAQRRNVTVSGRGRTFVFRLEPVPPSSLPHESAPASGWRIASGAAAFLR